MILPFPLILASTSRYRAQLLSQLGWDFESFAPDVDEDQYKNGNLSPADLAKKLSNLKAQAISLRYPKACVIGSDQVCHIEGKILGKPHTTEKAFEQLLFMQSKTHELLTAVTIISPGNNETFINSTRLKMRSLNKDQIQKYVEADSPLDCAGSYKLESRGIKLFESIETSDHTAIIGLPLISVSNILVKLGYPI